MSMARCQGQLSCPINSPDQINSVDRKVQHHTSQNSSFFERGDAQTFQKKLNPQFPNIFSVFIMDHMFPGWGRCMSQIHKLDTVYSETSHYSHRSISEADSQRWRHRDVAAGRRYAVRSRRYRDDPTPASPSHLIWKPNLCLKAKFMPILFRVCRWGCMSGVWSIALMPIR